MKLNLKKFVYPDQRINLNAIENFRRNHIFINEMPSFEEECGDTNNSSDESSIDLTEI